VHRGRIIGGLHVVKSTVAGLLMATTLGCWGSLAGGS
jgi:hypothetical protein